MEPTRSRRLRIPKRTMVAALMAVAAVGLGACGGGGGSSASGVASLGSTTTTAKAGGVSGGAVAYSQCMRDNGVPEFPDPDSSGRLLVQGGSGSAMDPSSPEFQKAEEACKDKAPPRQKGGGGGGAANGDAMLKFSQCMRDNGISQFPDPKLSDGRVDMRLPDGIDTSSPAFQKASDACKSLLPGGGSGLSTGPQ